MVSVVILSLTKDNNSFEVVNNCVNSFDESILVNDIIVVESNKSFNSLGFKYTSNKVKVIIPPEEFNYNKFFNIGKRYCINEFIIFSNNDLVVEEGCVEGLVECMQKDNELMGVSPIDRNWHRHSYMYFPNKKKLYTGHYTALHTFGCIYMLRKSLFEKVGDFDERFYFFYQDNDLATTMYVNKMKHGIYTGSHVRHKIAKHGQPDGGEQFRYTPENMNIQGNILGEKWKHRLEDIR